MGSSHNMFSWVESTATQDSMKINKSNNFVRTCNRFSQFLKERRGSFGDVGFSSSFDLKDGKKLSGVPSDGIETTVAAVGKKSLNLFPLSSSSSDANFEESNGNITHSRTPPKTKEESKNSMTIIYDGKVLVFDDLQQNMAQEIMSLASRGVATTPRHEPPYGCENTVTAHFTHGLSDLPIKRGASLHRFMEKRKHRIAASAPYNNNNNNNNNSSSSKQLLKQQEEKQLELKL